MSKPAASADRHEAGQSAGRPARTDQDHVRGRALPKITDESMRGRISQAKLYTAVVLTKTASFDPAAHAALVWEHGRRNMALMNDGVLAIVLPGAGEPEFAGIGVFDASAEEVAEIMDSDPGVQAELFQYEIHPVRGFPDSQLPA